MQVLIIGFKGYFRRLKRTSKIDLTAENKIIFKVFFSPTSRRFSETLSEFFLLCFLLLDFFVFVQSCFGLFFLLFYAHTKSISLNTSFGAYTEAGRKPRNPRNKKTKEMHIRCQHVQNHLFPQPVLSSEYRKLRDARVAVQSCWAWLLHFFAIFGHSAPKLQRFLRFAIAMPIADPKNRSDFRDKRK